MNSDPDECPHGYSFDTCTQCHEAYHAGRSEERRISRSAGTWLLALALVVLIWYMVIYAELFMLAFWLVKRLMGFRMEFYLITTLLFIIGVIAIQLIHKKFK